MLSINIIRTARNTGVFSLISNDRLLFAALEGPEHIVLPNPGALDRVIEGALQASPPAFTGAKWPETFAESIDETLRNWRKHELQLDGLYYAGLSIERDEISVCTAGDMRLHLVENGIITNSTCDHTIIVDPVEGISEKLTPVEQEVMIGVPSRWLGSDCERSPEAAIWHASSAYSIVLVSSGLHQHQLPESYLPRVLDRKHPDPSEGDFLLVEIQRIGP